ncbi:hypothetical protein HPP92_021505 [Vanilla planifolia]|uniref:DUF3741 domain-containing protein n=1 Tax=Vanilla planifolia TaxID=51239 RepID=A0A835UH89_VANPL|nr:hypothetical protein HPP92_021870 [Vanilla planifolia]KAG0463029.1 hypothetical protein HPP92_021505 [Vanilla planifolia]
MMSLAITEKRSQRRPGGCAGIFFQLLEWNRKLAKKKLFSKKLLPPVRVEKRSAKKFGVEGKRPMAKLLLIANENRGGFPCVKKVETDDDLGNGKRDPGLVARLMGLESMPVFGHDKPRNALDSKVCYDGDNSRAYSRLDQDLCFEVGAQGRYEARPQKLQKTGGFLERPSVPARYSPEVSRKVAVNRTRKQQHKLTSPLKSPRLLSMSNQARLMHAASKILEPGMQSRSRNRRGITSMGSLVSESLGSEAAMPFKGSKEPLNDSLIGSCRSCGGTIHLSQLRHCLMEPLVARNGSSPSKLHDQGRKHHISSDPQEVSVNNASKIKNPRKSESSIAVDDVVHVHGSKLYGRRQVSKVVTEIVGTRDLRSVRRNLNSTSCTIGLKPASKVSNSGRVRTDANAWEKNVPHKRRSNSNLQNEKGSALNPNSKQRNIKTDLFGQKDRASVYGRAIRGGCARKVNIDGPRRISRESGTVSFALNSPMKQSLSNFVGKAASGNAGDKIDQNCRTVQSERLVCDATREKE